MTTLIRSVSLFFPLLITLTLWLWREPDHRHRASPPDRLSLAWRAFDDSQIYWLSISIGGSLKQQAVSS